MIALDLFYDQSKVYVDTPLDDISEALEDLVKSKNDSIRVSVNKTDRKSLTGSNLKDIADRIRSIKPQTRGSVAASGGDNLPLSGSKKLNLNNTPILLVSDESGTQYVFPCRIGESYYDVLKGIKFLRDNLPNLVALPARTEEIITEEILNAPEELERGLIFVSRELETSRGKADILFRDSNGRMLLVEVEREATDQSVGQILRLCAGYEDLHSLEPGTIRAGVACLRINENVRAAAKRAGINVWIV